MRSLVAIIPLTVLGCSAVSPEPAPVDEDQSGSGGSGEASSGGGTGEPTAPLTGGGPGVEEGSSTGGTGVLAPPGCPAGSFICDSFEEHTLDAEPSEPWTVIRDAYQVNPEYFARVSNEQAHSGEHSIKVVGGQAYTDRVLVGVPSIFEEVPNNHFFVRFWTYLVDDISDKHSTYALAAGEFVNDIEREELRIGANQAILVVHFFKTGAESLRSWFSDKHDAGEVPPVGQWFCTEVEFNGQDHTMRYWLDDRLIPQLSLEQGETDKLNFLSIPEDWSPTYEDFRFGWQSYYNQAMTAYFDDIVLSQQRIGCTDEL